MSALDALLDALPRWVLVGGKGGVGKTTCAAALAARSAARGATTLLLSVDPARSLGSAIAQSVGGEPAAVAGQPKLYAMQLDPEEARTAFLEHWRGALVTILDRGTYLDRSEAEALVDAALPGADETMAVLALLELERSARWARVIVDTAPTGHTLRLLGLPSSFRALTALLESMQSKHRFMVQALTHRYRADLADAFLAEMSGQVEALQSVLRDPARSALVLVARPEPLVAAESARFVAALAGLRLSLGAIVVNAVPARPLDEEAESLGELAELAAGVRHMCVPRLEAAPIGLAAIARWGKSLRDWRPVPTAPRRRHAEGSAAPRVASSGPSGGRGAGGPSLPFALTTFTVVGGKGGVGKTTVSCALGLTAAAASRRVLVVSTDPAPSVADAFAQPVGENPTPVDGAPGLFAQQLDASAAFDRFRARYSERVEALFDSLAGGALEAAHDRRIARELLALAPPGIDEVYALAALGEAAGEQRYAAVVVDPAPTGHLLRLLEMPALALEWTHLLMRLMLRYREIVALGDSAEELLAFARRTRALQALLADPERARVLVVALDEPLVRAETERLVASVRGLGLAVTGVLWNRVACRPAPLPGTDPASQFVAERVEPPPRGVPALRRWAGGWGTLNGMSECP